MFKKVKQKLMFFSEDETLKKLFFNKEPSKKIKKNQNDKISPDYYINSKKFDPKLTSESKDLLKKIGFSSLGEKVSIFWNKSLITSAGNANYRTKVINLNPKLLNLDDDKHEVYRTLKHELAHLVAHYNANKNSIRRIKPHGTEWKKACLLLGIKGEKATHSLPFKSFDPKSNEKEFHNHRSKPKYIYKCGTCDTILYRWRKINKKIACKKCCINYNNGKFSRKFLFEFSDYY